MNEAIKYPNAKIFSFNDGIIKMEMTGVMNKHIRTKQAHIKIFSRYVAPLVTNSWKKNDPVTLWVGTNKDTEKINWTKSYRKGFKILDNNNYYKIAIIDAEKKHGIKSKKDAPVIIWTTNPSSELNLKILISSLISGFFILIWLIATPILRSKNKI